jgi:enterobactin synthetase component D
MNAVRDACAFRPATATAGLHALTVEPGVHWHLIARDEVVPDPDHSVREHLRRLRQLEFALGRAVAATALRQAGAGPSVDPLGCGVPRAPDGAPIWPVGWVGSISHSKSWVAAAVAPESAWRGLGIDVEELAAGESVDAIDAVCLNAAERRLARGGGLAPATARLLMFSAKESLYKCLYPMVRRFFDFPAAEVVAIDWTTNRMTLDLRQDLSPQWRAGTSMQAHFALEARHVVTLVGAPALTQVGRR